MKNLLLLVTFGIIGGVGIFYFVYNSQSFISPLGKGTVKQAPLLAYTFENLEKTTFPRGHITLGRLISETADFTTQMFYYTVPKIPNSDQTSIVSGLMNIPKARGEYPVVIMFRGYSPKETYAPGVGTQPSAKVLAEGGFITLAPDFLGYGESASPSADPFEERFQTYTTALSLLSSLPSLSDGMSASYSGSVKPDTTKVGIWGHSNGGHIALATIAISGLSYPTVLWAPVSKSFPYSILYYTDETDDQGKQLRKALSSFEQTYDTEQFSPTNYYSRIKAPIEIHQGESDHEVPVWWSDELLDTLKKDSIDTTYFTYPGSDHNLLPGGWNSAVIRSMTFYTKYFRRKN